MFFLTGIIIAFFLAALMLSKKKKTTAERLLSAWLVVIGLHLTSYYLFFSEQIYQYPWMLGWEMPLPLVHGPFLYLYTAALTNRLPQRKWILLHFLPALASYLYMISFFIMSDEEKIFTYQNQGAGFEVFMSVRLYSVLLSGIAYFIATQLLLAKHRAAILHQFSNTDRINLRWLQYLSLGLAMIWIPVIAGEEVLTFSFVVLFVLFMGYFGIRQTGIFTIVQHHMPGQPPPSLATAIVETEETSEPPGTEVADEARNSIGTTEVKKKYSRSGLSEELATSIHAELTQLMVKEKLYTENDLSLADLASRLNVPSNYLSQVINEKEEKNFYDYINTLRIDHFKQLLSDPANQKYTILSLAYECGFNSKSSFNRCFKKATGQAPSEYLQKADVEI